MVISLVWMHQAAKNVRSFNLWGLRYTPGGVVGWWCVPIASLWMPFQAMKEVWKASDPDNVGSEPSSWMNRPVPGIMTLWWLAYIGAGFVAMGAVLPAMFDM